MKRKVLAVLLSGAMCVSYLPVTALAAGNVPEETLNGSQILEETYTILADETVDSETSETESDQAADESSTEEGTAQDDAAAGQEGTAADETTGQEGAGADGTTDQEGAGADGTTDQEDAAADEMVGQDGAASDEGTGQVDAADETSDTVQTQDSSEETTGQDVSAGTDEAESGTDTQTEESVADGEDASEGADSEGTYKIYLPDGYDPSGSQQYPTIYLMPYDGYDADGYVSDGIQERLDELMASDDVVDMIVVMPEYSEGDDYRSSLDDLVADVDANFCTIADSSYRAILGVNVGAYMAMETTLISQSDLFYAVGSHMGDFTSEANPYTSYGSVADTVSGMDDWASRGYQFLSSHYIYIDGPNGDISTTEDGGTADIASGLEKRSNPYWQWGGFYYMYGTPDTDLVEYNVLDGEKDAEFYLNSMERSLNRFSARFTESLYSGELKCTPQAVKSTDAQVTASVTLTLSEDLQQFVSAAPQARVSVELTDPDSGDVLYADSQTLSDLALGEENTITFAIDTSNMASGLNTTVTAYVSFLGMSQEIGSLSLVSVADTDEQQIDLMGDWYFKAYKMYSMNDTTTVELDDVANVTSDVYTTWDVVQPALGWWTNDFSSDEGFSSNYGGYAWYVRTFTVPDDFATEGLVMAAGYFDEANEVYINGHLVGSTGMDYSSGVGVYDGSNPWDTNCVYDLDSSVLNYGGENTIAVRMCNSSGGGGWYEGPIGIYSVPAYNAAAGKPSELADADMQDIVAAMVAEQTAAIKEGDAEAYADTVAADYFEAGVDKAQQVEKVSGWISDYTDIEITDKDINIFEDGELYDYRAIRMITGKNADGETVEIYSGEINDYYKVEDGAAIFYGSHSRFFEMTYYSETLGEEESCYIYLPEGYFDTDNVERYQSMYLLHGINSQANTYAIDDIDQVLDDAIASGEIEEMIVVIPSDPTKSSFWQDGVVNEEEEIVNVMTMVTEDLRSTVDEQFRTIDDARYRYTAGCSMGGGGAYSMAITHPNLFSGIISFYGALNYVGAEEITNSLSAEYLNQYSYYFACGNQDLYNFYEVQETISNILSNNGVEHYHYIDNGEHANTFYLPLFISAVSYTQERMYSTSDSAEVLSGNAEVEEADGNLKVAFTVDVSADVSKYLDEVVASSYTENTNPDLQIPVEIIVIQDGVRKADVTEQYAVSEAGTLESTVEIPTDDIDTSRNYTVEVYASVLENTVLIDSETVELQHEWVKGDTEYTSENALATYVCSICGETKQEVDTSVNGEYEATDGKTYLYKDGVVQEVEPGTEDPGTEEPGTEEPGTEDPGKEDPGTEDPGTEDPGTEDPGTEEPGTNDPGTEDPGTEDPGTNAPSTDDGGDDTNVNNQNTPADQTGNNSQGTNQQTTSDQKSAKSAATGDNSMVYTWIILFAAAGCSALVVYKKRRKNA